MNSADPTHQNSSGNRTAEGDSSSDMPDRFGDDPEVGMLTRVRQWIDLLPWLRLLRVLRMAGSPPLLLTTSIGLGAFIIGEASLFGRLESPLFATPGRIGVEAFSRYLAGLAPTASPAPYVGPGSLEAAQRNMTQLGYGGSLGAGHSLLAWGLAVIVWAPIALVLLRQGALLTADRPLISLRASLSLALRRAPFAWLSSLIPVLCMLPMVGLIFSAGWLASWLPDYQPLHALVGLMTVLLSIPCGLLAFGSQIAIPISWAALANERDPDPLDSLSRGYEYLFRRPIHLIAYALVSALLLTVVTLLAGLVADAARTVGDVTLAYSGAGEDARAVNASILEYLPMLVALTVLWGLIGGVYLLLRFDAGGQEVEDLWEPPIADRPSLPQLPPVVIDHK